MWIVKLGGSLSRDARLPRWLKMLADLGRGRVVEILECMDRLRITQRLGDARES